MAKKIAFRVEFDGEWHDVVEPGLSDLVAFEKKFDMPASALEPETEPVLDAEGNFTFDDEGELITEVVSTMRLEWMVFLLWRGLRKTGVIAKDVPFDDDFIDRVDDVEVPQATKEEVADPQTPALPSA